MKFTCEKERLLSALTITSRTVSPKNVILALEGILLESKNNQLYFTGYNLETGIHMNIAAEVEEEGSLVLSARLFVDIIRKMPNQEITISTKGFVVTIICGQIQFQVMAIDPADFPDLPDVEHRQGVRLKQATLKTMISTTLFAVSTNESRPIHTGSLFDVDGTELRVVSVDGYRLAMRKDEVAEVFGVPQFSFVVPRTALLELEKICESEGEAEVGVFSSEKHIRFELGGCTLITRRLEGEFLAYRTAIPRDNNILLLGNRRDLLASIDRVSLMISEKAKAPLRCDFKYNSVLFSSKTTIGEAHDACPLEGDGEDLEIGFNHRYLQEALKAAPADRVCLEFSKAVHPCVIVPEDKEDDSFCYMVLPVRLK